MRLSGGAETVFVQVGCDGTSMSWEARMSLERPMAASKDHARARAMHLKSQSIENSLTWGLLLIST